MKKNKNIILWLLEKNEELNKKILDNEREKKEHYRHLLDYNERYPLDYKKEKEKNDLQKISRK